MNERVAGTADLGFIHRFVPATAPGHAPLLLLHGTGGNENDLVPLGAHLAPGAALLSPRGKVLENGMPRFFRRIGEGVLDLQDLGRRSRELADFIVAARHAYDLDKPIAIGFSNGANIALALLIDNPDLLAGAVLIRAMPFDWNADADQSGARVPVLLLSGAMDPLVPAQDRDRLAALIKATGADLTYQVVPAGHALSPQDLKLAAHWLAQR